MSDIPFADLPWSEIIPGLWQGGHDYQDPSSGAYAPAVVGGEFDVVFSLYRRAGHGPAEGVLDLVLAIPDGTLSRRQLDEVRAMADLAAEAVRDGRRVLVRCQAGYNRSGLVVAFVLLRAAWAADAAIDHVRAKRSPWALCNEAFVTYIHAEAVRLAREASTDLVPAVGV